MDFNKCPDPLMVEPWMTSAHRGQVYVCGAYEKGQALLMELCTVDYPFVYKACNGGCSV